VLFLKTLSYAFMLTYCAEGVKGKCHEFGRDKCHCAQERLKIKEYERSIVKTLSDFVDWDVKDDERVGNHQ